MQISDVQSLRTHQNSYWQERLTRSESMISNAPLQKHTDSDSDFAFDEPSARGTIMGKGNIFPSSL